MTKTRTVRKRPEHRKSARRSQFSIALRFTASHPWSVWPRDERPAVEAYQIFVAGAEALQAPPFSTDNRNMQRRFPNLFDLLTGTTIMQNTHDHPSPHTRDLESPRTRKVAGKKSRQTRKFSWRTARRFGFPSAEDRRLAAIRFSEIQEEYKGDMPIPGAGRICLQYSLFSSLVTSLETIALPTERYDAWLCGGEHWNALSSVFMTLAPFVSAERSDRIEAALYAIEAYPSMKPIERVQIERVLAEVGDIWPA